MERSVRDCERDESRRFVFEIYELYPITPGHAVHTWSPALNGSIADIRDLLLQITVAVEDML